MSAPDLARIRQVLDDLVKDLEDFGHHDTAFTRKLIQGKAARARTMIVDYFTAKNVGRTK